MAAPTVLLAVAEGVATVSLDRPERHNAIDDAMHDLFVEVWAAALADPAVRVVLLRGEGPSFCSGRDTSQLGHRVAGEGDLAFVRRHQQSRISQLGSPKPVVAALRGHVLGGGLEMALACDLRVASTDVHLAFPEVRYGLMTDTGGAPLTTALAGPSRAKWMLMTGRPVDATRALAWGLVDEVVDPADLDGTALDLAREIASRPPDVLAMIKQTVDGLWHGRLHEGLRAELLAQVALFGGDDYRERARARSAGA